MAFYNDLLKGYGPSLAVGIGVALVAPVILPAVASIFRPLVKGAVRGGLTLADSIKEFTASTGEQVSDLYAEAKAEHYGKAK
jgi:predicted metal-dependent phosphoesterase TrpH